MASEYKVLLIGGRGTIGSGLRTYMPRLDPRYQFVSMDLPGAPDKATEPDAGITSISTLWRRRMNFAP